MRGLNPVQIKKNTDIILYLEQESNIYAFQHNDYNFIVNYEEIKKI